MQTPRTSVMTRPAPSVAAAARSLVTVMVVASMLLVGACTSTADSQPSGGGGASATSTNPSPSQSPPAAPSAPAPSRKEAKVRVTNLPAGEHLEVTDAGLAKWHLPATGKSTASTSRSAIVFGSHVYSLTPSGPLGQAATVEMALDRPAAAGRSVVVVTRQAAADPWTYLPGSLTADRIHVRFTTGHLSEYAALLIDPDALLKLFKKYFVPALDGQTAAKAQRVSCSGEHDARRDGFTVSSSSTQALRWCFGHDSQDPGQRVLKVVSRRPYLLSLSHPNMRVLRLDHNLGSWSNLRRVAPGRAVVEPGALVMFNADLAPGESEEVRSDLDSFSQNLYALQTGVQSLLAIGARLGAASNGPSMQIVDRLLRVRDCDASLTHGSAAVLKHCFNPDAVVQALGSVGLLLAPLMTVRGLPRFFTSSYRAVVNEPAGRDAFSVRINRRRPPAPVKQSPSLAAFHRTWLAHTSHVQISRSGHAHETIGEGCCDPIIDLDYQLSNPRRIGHGWVAAATVTKVELHDFSEGRRPRVGRSYQVRVVGPHYYGVAFPTFAFCNPDMAHWDCGA